MAKFSADNYFSVELATLKTNKVLPFDVFIYLPLNERIVRFRQKNALIEPSAVSTLLKRGHEQAFIHNDDLEKYKIFCQDLVVEDPKMQPFRIQAAKIMTDLLNSNEQSHKAAKESAKQMVKDIISKDPQPQSEDFIDLLANPEIEHATSVAIYSVIFAIAAGYEDTKDLQDISIASLVHDLGLTQLMPNLIGIPAAKRTEEETKKYEQHVDLGIELLKQTGFTFSPKLLSLLQEHHEKFDGTGFPKKIGSFTLGDLPQILSLADILDSIARGWYDGTPRSLSQSLKFFTEIEAVSAFPHYLNPDLLKKILEWLKICSAEEYLNRAIELVEQTKQKIKVAV